MANQPALATRRLGRPIGARGRAGVRNRQSELGVDAPPGPCRAIRRYGDIEPRPASTGRFCWAARENPLRG